MDFKHIFKQWGKWATPRLEMDYPCVTVSIPVPSGGNEIIPMSDDLAMAIHDCVIALRKISPELYDVFMATYAYRLPKKNEYDRNHVLLRKGIYEIFGISSTTYEKLLFAAEKSLALALVQGKCIMLA